MVVDKLRRAARRVWALVGLAAGKFFRLEGAQWAAAFGFNAFFSLFPLIFLLVTIASFFVDQERAGNEVIAGDALRPLAERPRLALLCFR